MIEEYKFGFIIVDGKRYDYDVEVRWTGDVLSWERKESHIINVESVKRALEQKPETIIVGTGESGMAKVTEEADKLVKEKGIRIIVNMTGEAVKVFNEEKRKGKKVIGLFHLTC